MLYLESIKCLKCLKIGRSDKCSFSIDHNLLARQAGVLHDQSILVQNSAGSLSSDSPGAEKGKVFNLLYLCSAPVHVFALVWGASNLHLVPALESLPQHRSWAVVLE